MASLHNMVVRDDADESASTTSIVDLVLAVLACVFFALCLVGIFFILRRRRRAQRQGLLPTYQRSAGHRNLTISTKSHSRASNSVHVIEERRNLMENSSAPPLSPVPEIHITFPDEEDSAGKKQSGCVVVVRIGETGSIGMEPVSHDALPPYQSSNAERFHSLDLDRMGGLREKHEPKGWA